MNRALIILALTSLVGCKDNRVSDKMDMNIHFTKTNTVNLLANNSNADILYINTIKSVVEWKGTKLMQTGKHEGTVKFKSGKMSFSNGKLVGGQFVVDMKSIYITDIPINDPEPRKNLTNHLNKDFQTGLFPIALFTITTVKESSVDSYTIMGNMSIKNITRPITVMLKEIKREKEYFSAFIFDRFQWKIGENGSWLEKKLVDANVSLKIKIVLL